MAREIQGRGPRDGDPEDVQPSVYDRGFESAIREGHLTAREAAERGNRQAYAEHLTLRLGIPIELALRVADKRVGLYEALRQKAQIQEEPAPQSDPARPLRWRSVTWLVGLLIVAGLFGTHQWQRQQQIGRQLEQFSSAAPRPEVAENARAAAVPAVDGTRAWIERDERGRVTRVSAGNPAVVLAAFCDVADLSGACRSAEVRPTKPPFPGRRLGRLTIANDVQDQRIILIRRDRSGRWFAGTGIGPIIPEPGFIPGGKGAES
jgi:hypothetical protein